MGRHIAEWQEPAERAGSGSISPMECEQSTIEIGEEMKRIQFICGAPSWLRVP